MEGRWAEWKKGWVRGKEEDGDGRGGRKDTRWNRRDGMEGFRIMGRKEVVGA